MQRDEQEDTSLYSVVMNHEEQYSIWPADRELPLGWTAVGKVGSKAECLAHIEAVWTDMRPLSLRRRMEEIARSPQPATQTAPPDAEEGPDLVQRLSVGTHAVEVGLRPERTVAALRDAIDRGYVHIRFTETTGGTELGVRLDRADCDLSRADLVAGTGTIRLAGTLTLDFVKVRCSADIDLPAMTGRGHLDIQQS